MSDQVPPPPPMTDFGEPRAVIMTTPTPDPVAYWLARLAAAERSADYARAQLAAARAREETPHG